MWWLRNKKIVAVHSGNFHADEIFAVAILSLFLGYKPKIWRTREEKILAKADYLLDIGREYNPAKKIFDHHQNGLNPRVNGIPYASAGLVWKEYGEKICQSKEIAEIIDRKIIQDIDAADNGLDVYGHIAPGVESFLFQDFLYSLNPTWREEGGDKSQLKKFNQAVDLVREMLSREIKRAGDYLLSRERIKKIYEQTTDKRIIILDDNYLWRRVLNDLPEPLFVIRPIKEGNLWHVSAVKVRGEKFKNRLNLPLAWGGKSKDELVRITGIPDVLFCHRNLFMCSAGSKKAAIKLAELAINNFSTELGTSK